MKKILNNIRNKPDHVKSRFVVVFAVLATAIVLGIWVMSLRLVRTPDDVIKTESPLKVFGQIFSKTVNDATTNYKNQKDALSAAVSARDASDASNSAPTMPDETAPASTTP